MARTSRKTEGIVKEINVKTPQTQSKWKWLKSKFPQERLSASTATNKAMSPSNVCYVKHAASKVIKQSNAINANTAS